MISKIYTLLVTQEGLLIWIMLLQSCSPLPGELPADILGCPGGELVTHHSHPEDGGLGEEQLPGEQLRGRHEAEALGAAVLEAEQGRGRHGQAGHQESRAAARCR